VARHQTRYAGDCNFNGVTPEMEETPVTDVTTDNDQAPVAGVNPADAGNRSDGSWAGLRVPCVLGYDIAGVVDMTGPKVANADSGAPKITLG